MEEEIEKEFVYIIGKGTNLIKNYKIGKAFDVEARMKALQIGNEDKLQIYYSFECKYPYRLEKLLHNHYKEYRKLGEWFTLSNDIMDSIEEVAKKYIAEIDGIVYMQRVVKEPDCKINVMGYDKCKFQYDDPKVNKHVCPETFTTKNKFNRQKFNKEYKMFLERLKTEEENKTEKEKEIYEHETFVKKLSFERKILQRGLF